MSRTKKRKAQRRADGKRKQLILLSGLFVIIVGIVGLLLAPSRSNSEQTVVQNGERPPWQSLELVDGNTGNPFTLADFDNKHVVVKIMSPY